METQKRDSNEVEIAIVSNNLGQKYTLLEENSLVIDESLSIYSGLILGDRLDYKVFNLGLITVHFEDRPNELVVQPSVFYLYKDGTYRHYVELNSEAKDHESRYPITFQYRLLTLGGAVLDVRENKLRDYVCQIQTRQFGGRYDSVVYNETQIIDLDFYGKAVMCY